MLNKMNRHNLTRLSIWLLVLIIGMVIISGRGCPKRSRDKIRSSSDSIFIINAPSNLTAAAVSPYQINLSWQDNSNNENGFEIQRRISLYGDWTLLSSVSTDISTYTDLGIFSSGLTYYYRVRAFNTIGDTSEWSNDASVRFAEIIDIVNMDAGASYSLLLDTNGRVWSWGCNTTGQLGLLDWRNRLVPVFIASDFNYNEFEDVNIISAGGIIYSGHSVARKTDGTLWSWGYNNSGQMGVGDTINTEAPFPVTGTNGTGFDTDWSAIATGRYHSVSIKSSGTLWAWGFNNYGQLGVGDIYSVSLVPIQVVMGTDTDWTRIAAGCVHTMALKTNSTLWAWGRNKNGQLGLGDTTNRSTPVQVDTNSDWFFIDGGGAAGGDGHSLAIKNNSTFWTWGYNNYGQLGLGNSGSGTDRWIPIQVGTESDWVMAAAGSNCTFGLKNTGTLWAWGQNSSGQLGLGNNENRMSPVQIGTQTDWVNIKSGENHSLGLKTGNTLWSWGYNDYGQLGLGDSLSRNTPTQIIVGIPEEVANLVIKPISSTQINLTWIDYANNESGFRIERKSGRNGTYSDIAILGSDITSWADISQTGFAPGIYYYYRVRAFNDFGESMYSEGCTALSGDWINFASSWHTFGRKNSGTLWVWGNNQAGQLGLGDSETGTNRNTPTQLGTETDWGVYAIGDGHTVLCKASGTLWSCGSNWDGQLGLNDYENRNTLTRVGTDSDWSVVAACSRHTIACKTEGTLWSWGKNDSGELGLGDTGIYRVTPTRVGTDSDWLIVSGGENYSNAIKTNKTLWSWGSGMYGQLGLGNLLNKRTPAQVGSDSDWVSIAARIAHNLGIRLDGTLWAWGRNGDGQLGINNSNNQSSPVKVGTQSDWSRIAVGEYHSLALKSGGTLWSWGDNAFAQLGLGESGSGTDRWTPAQIGTESDWAGVTAGFNHGFALKTSGVVWAWGFNGVGQLGLGDLISRNRPTVVGE